MKILIVELIFKIVSYSKETSGRRNADGMHLPVDSVGCGENYDSVGSHEGAGLIGSSLGTLRSVDTRYTGEEEDDDEGGGGASIGGTGGEMSEGAAVGELWWTERLVGEAQAEHPGELVRTGKYFFLICSYDYSVLLK